MSLFQPKYIFMIWISLIKQSWQSFSKLEQSVNELYKQTFSFEIFP